MPGRDGTGPMGMGLMTGRGFGYCYQVGNRSGIQSNYFGGYGCGKGYRRQFWATGTQGYLRNRFSQNIFGEDEKSILIQQESILENQLKQVRDRLSDMDRESE